jgi:hypothetical protein
MKRTLKPFTFLLILAASLGVAAVVWAYWTVSGSGSATGGVADLDTPTFTSITVNGADVTVDWSDVLAPGGGAIDGYYVQRYVGATPSAACASSPATLLTSSTCVDTGVATGTYTYRVTAVYESWTEQSAASGDVVVAAATAVPPTATVTFPADDSFLSAAAFNGGCTPTGACGTAADPDGVQSVSVSIQRGTSTYWNGTAFASVTEVFQPATLATPGGTTTNWNYAFALPADGFYTVRVQAVDGDGNGYAAGVYAAESTFFIDTVAPDSGAVTVNSVAASLAGSSSFNNVGGFPIDSRTDYTDSGSGIDSSTLTRQAGTLSNNACSSYGAGTTLVGTPAQSGLTTGCYLYTLTGTDNAGNTASITTTVKVDTVSPSGGLITANNGNVFNTSGTVALNVTSFVDAHSGISSNNITRSSGTLAANACGGLSGSTAVTVSGGNDSASLPTGCYQYTLTGVDNAGNSTPVTSSVVKVDRTAPSTPTLAFSALTNAFFNSGGNTLYFRAATGGYTVTASSTDADTLIQSGNAGYAFSSLAANNFVGTQTAGQVAYTFGATSTAPGASPSVTATNNAGASSAAAAYGLVADNAAPTGGAVTANGGNVFNTTGTVALSVTNFTDAGSGVASNTLTRSTGTLSANACGTLSGSTAVTVSGGNDSATLTTGCYQYTLTGTDNVGNTATATSGVIKVDTVAPGTTINFPLNQYVYTTTNWASGCTPTAGICGSTGDVATGPTNIQVSIQNPAGLYWNGALATPAFSSATEVFNNVTVISSTSFITQWRYALSQTSVSTVGVYNVRLRGNDNAGNTNITTSKFRTAARAFAITSTSTSGNKATFTGTSPDTTLVTVKVCQVAGSGSPAPDFSTCTVPVGGTVTATPAAGGGWTTGQTGTLVNKAWYHAQATMTDLLGNAWQYITTAPFEA